MSLTASSSRGIALAWLTVIVLIAGCNSSAATPIPSASAGPSGSPGASPSADAPAASPSSGDSTVLLAARITQALGPEATFTWLPLVLVTSDHMVLAPTPTPAIAPGPLVTGISARSLDANGWTEIEALIQDAGLLDGEDVDPGPDVAIELGGGSGLMGGQMGHLEVIVDDIRYDISGDAAAAGRCGATFCPAAEPGTPEAFAQVWSRLTDLEGWLGGSLGVDQPYRPAAYAVLTGPPSTDEPRSGAAPEPWPLGAPLATLGSPLREDVTRRCGIVSGTDAATLGPVLDAATTATVWTDPSVVGSRIGLTVRPMLPGDADPCTPLSGGA